MYKPGQWRAHCDVCGFKFWSGDIRKRWDGLMVCNADFEVDHPQKYLRVRETSPSVPWVRHQEDGYPILETNICYLWAVSAYADLAEADCAKADNTQYSFAFLFDLKNASSG